MPCLFPHSPTVRMGDTKGSPSFLIVNGGGFAKEVRRPRRSDSPVGETGRSGQKVDLPRLSFTVN